MPALPDPVDAFLQARRLAVAGVSRAPNEAANHIFRKLKSTGHEVFPINPKAAEVEGTRCYPNLASVPSPVEGVVIATPPSVALAVVEQCVGAGVCRVWLHRSFGTGSVCEVRACADRGIECIVGGCPLMFCEPIDVVHRCMRWWLQRLGRAPR